MNGIPGFITTIKVREKREQNHSLMFIQRGLTYVGLAAAIALYDGYIKSLDSLLSEYLLVLITIFLVTRQ